MTFDATSREFGTVRRVRTNTPLQALTTLNDEAFFEAARALAATLVAQTGVATNGAAEANGGGAQTSAARDVSPASATPTSSPIVERATHAFRRVLARAPKTEEVDRIVASYTEQLARFRKDPGAAARVIEGHAVSGVDAAEQAAWTLVANALLNLDEALTKE